jgi:hypothetical protein
MMSASLAEPGLRPGFRARTCKPAKRARSRYESAVATAIKAAVPAAPPGWTLKDPLAKQQPSAPKDVCTGTDPVPGWYGTYEWNDEIKRAGARNQERDAKVRTASAWLPDEEKTLHEYEAQARDLGANRSPSSARILPRRRAFARKRSRSPTKPTPFARRTTSESLPTSRPFASSTTAAT